MTLSTTSSSTPMADQRATGPVLAFDTSTECLAVAVLDGQGQAHCQVAGGGSAASGALLPLIHSLLQSAGVALNRLQAIAFGAGPGAFTGLRTSCAVAQGLGLGLALPLLPLDSLLIVAEDAKHQLLRSGSVTASESLEVAVAVDARMQEVYAARYRWQPAGAANGGVNGGAVGGNWQPVQAPALMSLEGLQAAWHGVPFQVLAGSALAVHAQVLSGLLARHAVPAEHNRAQALLTLAQQAWQAGRGVPAAEALPIYLRDKVAQTTEERRAARQQAASSAAPVAS